MYLIIFLSLVIILLLYENQKIKWQLKQFEEALRENPEDNITTELSPKELEKLASQLNRNIEYYRSKGIEYQKKDKKLKDSIANISHDMRTPLTSVIGYLQLSLRSDDSQVKEENVMIALRKAEKLRTLISDFFELSLLENDNGELKLIQINAMKLLSEVILDNAVGFEQKNIAPILENAEKKVFVMAEKKALSRVFQNLIGNAIRYSSGNISFNMVEEKDIVHIEICNPVADIDSVNTEMIFERFYKEDAARNSEGTGLGLSIVKLLVGKMRGNAFAEKRGKNLVVIICLSMGADKS